MTLKNNVTYCGYVTIIGRPNVGKSTLLNNLIGQKISITSRKARTTRHHIIGINTDDMYQIIYLDTPGLQDSPAMGGHMSKEIKNAVAGVDLLMYMVEALKWTVLDDQILQLIKHQTVPVILVANKIDKIANKESILPYFKELSGKMDFRAIIPIFALSRKSLKPLEKCIKQLLPTGQFKFPDDYITDKPKHYFAAEFIREKLMRKLGAELPYNITVTIESFIEKEKIIHIDAVIWVKTKGQKLIIIGRKGNALKTVGERARHEMEHMFGNKVLLKTWVRVRNKYAGNKFLAFNS